MSVLMSGQTFAQGDPDPTTSNNGPLDSYVLFGINGTNDHLVSYHFAESRYKAIDAVHFQGGATLSGIEATAHVPGHLNLFGFWTDPGDTETKLVYIDCENAEAYVIGQSLGKGQVTGATIAWKDTEGELDRGGDNIAGDISINPSKSSSNMFELTRADGTKITRGDLHQDATIESDGTFYAGDCHYIKVRPKGRGSQSSLKVNGMTYKLQNDNIYVMAGGTMSVRVYNDHVNSNGKAMGHWWLDISDSGSAVIHEGNDAYGFNGLFAVQTIETDEEDSVPFDIVNGQVIPQEDYAAKVTVLGAAITAGGTYDIPVTVKLTVDQTESTPFGDFDKAVNGNINDDNNPRKHVLPSIYPAGTPITIGGRSWIKTKSWLPGNRNSHWQTYMTVQSDLTGSNMHVLRNGDPVPNIAPFMDQDQILDLIMDYVDDATNTIVLDENQAIFFYEMGTTNLSSSAADFQDLVVLVTLARDPGDLEDEDDDDDGDAGPASRLVKVNSTTGGFEQIMTLNRVYDGLAASDNGMFYASHQGQLYELNPFDQVETLKGSMPNSHMMGLEFAGPDLCGFTVANDRLVPIDMATGNAMASPMDTLASNLRTIIFMEAANLPNSFASFD